jgi:hypothetical protein
MILRGAVEPTSTADYPAFTATATFRSLSPRSAAWKLFDKALKLDLDRINSISIPNLAALPPVRSFLREGEAGPAVQWTFGKTTLGPMRKVLILSAVSAELECATPESAAAIIGRVLSDASAKSIDTAAFDANAGDDVRPPGLLYGAAPIPPATRRRCQCDGRGPRQSGRCYW